MKKKLLILIAMMLLVVGCANENKKENVSKDNNSPKDTVTDTNKKDDTTDTNKDENTDTSKDENTQSSSPAPAPTPTCTPKKFNGTYSYAYSTMEECKREGNILFMDITEDGNSDIFSYGCRQIVDECGTTYYGVFFYNAPDSEVYR